MLRRPTSIRVGEGDTLGFSAAHLWMEVLHCMADRFIEPIAALRTLFNLSVLTVFPQTFPVLQPS
jgi:hypothetical protein